MKKTTSSKMLGISLATSLIVASSITVQAVTNSTKGDFNSDGVIDSIDSTILKKNILLGSKDTTYDMNADTKINILDYIALSKMFVHTPLTDNTNITSAFTDVNFKNAVYALIGKNGPVPILYSDVKNLKNLNISSKSISSLSGIEYFTALTSLDSSYNNLTTLDISKNTTLTSLDSSYNNLATLDISKNTTLTYLDCGGNHLTSLDVSKNIALTYLDCDGNQLKTLDVSKNITLSDLDCYGNQLTTLDVTKNISLIKLGCVNNKLTTLDVSKNTTLTKLYCGTNQLTNLDVSKNIALTYLYCDNNKLITLDISRNKKIINLYCSFNQLTSLYFLESIEYADSYRPQYTDSTRTTTTDSLVITISDKMDITSEFTDVNFKTAVYKLIGKTSPSSILYSDVKNITKLDVGFNNISSLSGIEYFTSLTDLICSGNKLAALDITKNTALTKINCSGNQLKGLELSKNKALTDLDCYNNKIMALDVSMNTKLTYLFCVKNQIEKLDISNNVALTNLSCYYNQITTIDSIKNIWNSSDYNPQYIDSSQTTTINTLGITIVTPVKTIVKEGLLTVTDSTKTSDLINKNETASFLYKLYDKTQDKTNPIAVNEARMNYLVNNIAANDIIVDLSVFNATIPNVTVDLMDTNANSTPTVTIKPGQMRTIAGNVNSAVPTLKITGLSGAAVLVNATAQVFNVDIYGTGTLGTLYTTNSTASALYIGEPAIEASITAGTFIGILDDSVAKIDAANTSVSTTPGYIKINSSENRYITLNVSDITSNAYSGLMTTVSTTGNLDDYTQATLLTDDVILGRNVNDKLAAVLGKGAAVQVTFAEGSTNSSYVITSIKVLYTSDMYVSDRTITSHTAAINKLATVTNIVAASNPKSTIVMAVLPTGIDATQYIVTVGGVDLTYNIASGKFGGVVAKIYNTVAEAQADLIVTLKK